MRKLVVLVLLAAAVGLAAAILLRQGGKSTPAVAPPRVVSHLAPGVVPRAGIYRYAQSGYEQAKAGPITIRRRFPATGLLVVSGSGHVVQQEWRYSKQHLEAIRERVTPEGSYVVWQRTRLTMVVTQDEAHAATPATLTVPSRLHVGQRWVQSYRVGGVHSVSRNRVTGRCGNGCYVVVADSTVTGAHPGTERDVTWENPTTGVTLRETIDRRIGGTFPYRMQLTLRLLGKA
ncbi:MAG TPA: hypothetical protein VFA97_07455 [Gaiellaceae bacterium]|nr:hypothetical protein [Gaiellaceae bacterium]